MDERNISDSVARVSENSTAMRAAMDECELAEAFRDEAREAVVTDPKMTRAGYMHDSFGCSYY